MVARKVGISAIAIEYLYFNALTGRARQEFASLPSKVIFYCYK